MIDVAELITDPDFAQSYKVIRSTGKWDGGRFKIVSAETLKYIGAVQPAGSEDLEQIPEIDRTNVVLNFYCQYPKKLYISRDTDENADGEELAIYDTIEFKGAQYKIIKVLDWENNGYQMAFAVEKHE